MSKVDGKFEFSPISVNFLTEAAKVLFAVVMLLLQVLSTSFSSPLLKYARQYSCLLISTFIKNKYEVFY